MIFALWRAVARGTMFDLSDDTSPMSTPKYLIHDTCLNVRSYIRASTLVRTLLHIL